ncbi:hypothetical protein BGZ61DRAFT_221444 [Ilyonectria robusta]|uniref:uncharacterized protein n=1 Tax=Ilyonectria robusta TaxID=1079257 RepID=UPI001E8E8432|nr:uncharacterized protein BGZ61DRAFT_221444 [Ilyonectria robusta]KAH8706476.1 hypothetical protein BGZ61DRAFT_221444 [Ilyonectria robusta]
MAAASPKSTPKRKRGDEPWISPIKFSFEPPTASTSNDGSSSPRSAVAHKFRGLALESGGGATSDDNDAIESLRKRQRPDDLMLDAPQADPPKVDDFVALDGKPVLSFSLAASAATPQEEPVKLAQLPSPDGGLNRSYPSINRLADSKSRVKKRTSSPLRFKKTSKHPDEDDDDSEIEIVDPVRAALTWHEDEITMYDPEDEDDDGTGINGIGFKPTPALAHARTLKRRQQMAEYRKREESDARAKRSQRRRGASDIATGPGEKSPSRKVRFIDAEAQSIAITTG